MRSAGGSGARLVAGRQNHRVLGASHHRRRQRRIPLQTRGRQRYRENVIRRTEQLSPPGLVARWQISNLPLGRRREDGFALDTATEWRRQPRSNRAAAFFTIESPPAPNFPSLPPVPLPY